MMGREILSLARYAALYVVRSIAVGQTLPALSDRYCRHILAIRSPETVSQLYAYSSHVLPCTVANSSAVIRRPAVK